MKTLPHPDNLYLDAAVGWLMLGNPKAALEELTKLSAPARTDPEVLEVEWSAHALAEDWQPAFDAAERLVGLAPQRPFGWIHRAYAARRMPEGGLALAWAALRPAVEKFPGQYLIPYNLACYAAQMGRLDEAREWLERAFTAAADEAKLRQMALADRDLEALWPELKQREKPLPGTPADEPA